MISHGLKIYPGDARRQAIVARRWILSLALPVRKNPRTDTHARYFVFFLGGSAHHKGPSVWRRVSSCNGDSTTAQQARRTTSSGGLRGSDRLSSGVHLAAGATRTCANSALPDRQPAVPDHCQNSSRSWLHFTRRLARPRQAPAQKICTTAAGDGLIAPPGAFSAAPLPATSGADRPRAGDQTQPMAGRLRLDEAVVDVACAGSCHGGTPALGSGSRAASSQPAPPRRPPHDLGPAMPPPRDGWRRRGGAFMARRNGHAGPASPPRRSTGRRVSRPARDA